MRRWKHGPSRGGCSKDEEPLRAQLEAQGATSDVTRRLVQFIVDHHPERDDLDRTSVLTGCRESDRIIQKLMQWVNELHTA